MSFLGWLFSYPEQNYVDREKGIFWYEAEKEEGKWQGIPGIIERFKVIKPALYKKVKLRPLVMIPNKAQLICSNCMTEYEWNDLWKLCRKLSCAAVLGESNELINGFHFIEFNEDGIWE